MKYANNKVTNMKIAYIGGGSRGWAWKFMTDLATNDDMAGEVALYDIDREAAEHNAIIGNALKGREDVKGDWNYKVYDSLETVLTGADFVVISILPGTFDEMETDVHLPEKLGIYQSVGDTAGPGGIIRAMRTIPMFVEIAEAIKKFSPKAWVINYTNPMSVCVKTLYHVFPEIKAFGCCHEVFGTQKVLMGILNKTGLAHVTDHHEIEVNVLGINHFTWFDKASYKGIDLFPVYREYIDKNFEEGYFDEAKVFDPNDTFKCKNRVKFDLFNKYGLIAAAGDRHLVEFMPDSEYLRNPETVKSWNFGLTPVSWRKKDLEERLQKSAKLVAGEKLELKDTGEEGILLIRALCGLSRNISNVNIPNYALQIANLPKDAIVETNALFERDAIHPLFAGELPENILKLVMPHVENHERVLKAGISGDREMVEQAFKHDPLMKKLSASEAEALAGEMLEKTGKYLPQFKK